MLDLLEEVIVTPRQAFPRLPDLQVIERPGWLQILTPSIKTGGLNEVIYSLLDERSADATIDAAIAMYRNLGLKARWNAGPGSGPADLSERLERRGLVPRWGLEWPGRRRTAALRASSSRLMRARSTTTRAWLYRALVQARMAHARACGITLATSHAREATSAPILETLGFETVCRFPMYFG